MLLNRNLKLEKPSKFGQQNYRTLRSTATLKYLLIRDVQQIGHDGVRVGISTVSQ
jgi:hypothetical protein